MNDDRLTDDAGPHGVLTRLRRDKRGNAIAISAAALIPLLGFSGSAVDMARLYLVRVRLQQACDAGALAGRKVMTDTAKSTPLDDGAKKQASAFFFNNFRDGYLKTTAVSFTPAKASSSNDPNVANAITGNATATVPMAVMGFFGAKPVKMDVTCQAVFDLADTDVMFVLDTTGSMSCTASDSATCSEPITSEARTDGSNTTRYYNREKTDSKIEALRKAVILFDSTMRANADSSTHFRYGFVTYASSVNVGQAIIDIGKENGTNYLQNTNWTYDTRYLSPVKPTNVPNAIAGDYAYGSPTDLYYTGVPQSMCVAQRNPVTGFAKAGLTWSDQGYVQARSYYNLTWKADNKGTCTGKEQALRPMWRYGPLALSTSAWIASLRTGQAGAAVTNPSRLDGDTGSWRGCIEELNTTTGSSFDVTSLPDDLNPDVKPTAATNLWRPQWPDATWSRNGTAEQDVADDQVRESNIRYYTDFNYGPDTTLDKNGNIACGMPAQRLKVWTAQEVKDYLYNPEFRPYGGTYHDVGMIWGTRMLSPDGIFARDTAAWAGRKQPSRNIVFMTDGTMSPSQLSYGLYGTERLDNRTGGKDDTDADYDNHTARFLVECQAARRKGYTIYVVAVGTGISDDLKTCASPGQTFQASSTSELTTAFKTIAQRVAMLRISA